MNEIFSGVSSPSYSFFPIPSKHFHESVRGWETVPGRDRGSHSPIVLACITAYNEPAPALLYSLTGLFNNLDSLIRSGHQDLAENTIVCTVFDGREQMAESTGRILEELNLFSSESLTNEDGIHIFDSYLTRVQLDKVRDSLNNTSSSRWSDVYQSALKNGGEIFSSPTRASDCRVIVCVKEKNTGKLHSHWCFFECISSVLKPDYCLQMDVGTVPGATCIYHLWSYMERNPDVGAAASCILLPQPRNIKNLLELWQFGDFCVEKLLYWPSEIITGYLSVTPGQLSLLRWTSLTTTRINNRGELQIESNALQRYYRGLSPLNQFEANMFLAEDRVLGLEIATSSSEGWRLAFCPSAVAVTDPCETLTELLRQRRRWINSAFMARLWFFNQLFHHIFNNSRSFQSKLSLFRSTPSQGLRIFMEWFEISLLVISFVRIYERARAILQEELFGFTWSLKFLLFGVLISWIVFFVISTQNQITTRKEQFLSIGLYYITASVIIAFILAIVTLNISVLLPVSLITFGVAVGSTSHSHKFFSGLTKLKIWFYFLTLPAFSMLLRVYSFLNIHDCSWGTKGLTSLPRIHDKSSRFRWWFACLWLLSNILLTSIALSGNNISPAIIRTLYIIFLLSLIFNIITGLVFTTRLILNRFHDSASIISFENIPR